MKLSFQSKRAKLIAIGAAAIAALATVGYLATGRGESHSGAEAAALGTEKIVKTTLLDARTANGTLGFGSPTEAAYPRALDALVRTLSWR